MIVGMIYSEFDFDESIMSQGKIITELTKHTKYRVSWWEWSDCLTANCLNSHWDCPKNWEMA